jgi:predicted RNase H-like HicB family nuclease
MTIRVLLPFIAATFVYSGYALAEVRQPKLATAVSKQKVTPGKIKPQPKKLTTTDKTPNSTPTQPTIPKVAQPKWRVFTAPDGSFHVLMPGMPKQKTQVQKTHMGKINLQIFVAQPPEQEVAYVVTYNDFPYSYAQINSPEKILTEAQAQALKTTQSNLIRQRNIRSSNGHPGKEIEYINSIGKITQSRIFFANNRLYQVTAIASKKQHPTLAKTMTGYLNSFQLVLRP